MKSFWESGVAQTAIVITGIVLLFSNLRSCEKEKREARLECIKTKSVDECSRLIVN